MSTATMNIFWWTVLYTVPCMIVTILLLGYWGAFFALFICTLMVAFIEPEAFTDESLYFWKRIMEEP